MIIGSDIMHGLNIDLLFSEEIIRWGSAQNPFDYDSIPMEELGVVSDTDVYSMIYNLNTTSPILQQEEEQQGKNTRWQLLQSRHQRHGQCDWNCKRNQSEMKRNTQKVPYLIWRRLRNIKNGSSKHWTKTWYKNRTLVDYITYQKYMRRWLRRK